MKKPLILGFFVLTLIFMVLLHHNAHASGARVANEEFIHVIAKIDGSDWFEMTGNTWRWQHGVYRAPETHLNNENDSIFATLVNGQSFLSTWPDGLQREKGHLSLLNPRGLDNS